MKITEFLKLSLVELEPDKKMDFRTWLGIFAGAGSNNLQKIDDSAKEINNTITIIKNSPSTVFVDAKKKTVGIYVATVPSITPEATDLILNGIYILKLDTANETTSVSIRINDTIGKTLKKLNTTGVLVDLDIGDIQGGQDHLFRYNGQFLVLVNIDALTFMNKQIADFVLKNEVIDNLISEKKDIPLSANQGKVLSDLITAEIDNLKGGVAEDGDTLKKLRDLAQVIQSAIENVDNTHDIDKNVLSATKLTTARSINGVAFDGRSDIVVEDDTKILLSEKGVANGVATLDASGLVYSSLLPSYVDDVIELKLKSELPIIGEQGKIYVVYEDTKSNNGQYRWTGTVYCLINNPLDYATKQEATIGVENTKVMTPLRVKESIVQNIPIDNSTLIKVDGNLSVLAVKESNKKNLNKTWVGTSAEHEALEIKDEDTTYIITDDEVDSTDICLDVEKLKVEVDSCKSSITAFTATATHESVVNLYGRGLNSSTIISSVNNTILTDGYATMRSKGKWGIISQSVLATKALKPDAVCTLILDVKAVDFQPGSALLIGYANAAYPLVEQQLWNGMIPLGRSKIKVKTKPVIDSAMNLLCLGIYDGSAQGLCSITFRTMLLEGDWTSRDLPIDYWEDTYNYVALDIKNKPDRLPENYTVTFPAPSNAVAGEKLHINGVEHLKNLYGRGFNQPISNFKSYNAAYKQKGYAEFRGIFGAGQYVVSKEISSSKLKPNEKYTIITDILSNTNSSNNGFVSAFGGNGDCPFVETVQHGGKSEVGIFKDIVITKTDLTNSRLNFSFINRDTNGISTLRTMLLEGDQTAAPLPADYWENTYGIYDILGYGESNLLESNAFTAGQTVTLSIGLSGAYFANGMNKSLPLVMGGTQDLAAKQVRNMTASSAVPVGGMSGDIHIQLSAPNKIWVNENGIWK